MLIDRLAAAGVTEPDDVALVRGVISGLASEQLANAPGGRQYVTQIERGIRAVLSALGPPAAVGRRGADRSPTGGVLRPRAR